MAKSAKGGRGTRLVAAGRGKDITGPFVNPPVVHASTVLFDSIAEMHSGRARYTYARRGTPTMEALEGAIAEFECAAGTVLCPSGLNAISTALLAFVSAGDHVLLPDSLYHPARSFADEVEQRQVMPERADHQPARRVGKERHPPAHVLDRLAVHHALEPVILAQLHPVEPGEVGLFQRLAGDVALVDAVDGQQHHLLLEGGGGEGFEGDRQRQIVRIDGAALGAGHHRQAEPDQQQKKAQSGYHSVSSGSWPVPAARRSLCSCAMRAAR